MRWGWSLALALVAGCSVDPSGLATRDVGDGGLDAGSDAGSPPLDARTPDVAEVRDDAGRDASEPDAYLDAGADGGPRDAGCSVPPPPDAYVAPARLIQVDGEHIDWSPGLFVEIDVWDTVTLAAAPTAADLSARFAVAWQPDALYVAVHVRDDVHSGHLGDAAGLWMGDSVQIGFDVGANAVPLLHYDAVDDFEYGAALGGDAVQLAHRWIAPNGQAASGMVHRVVREGDRTRYELALRPEDLGLVAFEAGTRLRMGLIVNERDHGGRDGWLEWGGGIGRTKQPALFRDLYLDFVPCDAPTAP
ncbi:MAG: hypothetical protein KF901_17440 [Myxococcales bacterium]|nr:hypothetical protein [Myxococcales bacterium]